MANIYLQVDYKTGNIFQYSKTNQEGYESHINTNNVESWRKIYKKGLYAKLEGVSIRDTNFGKEVSIATKLANGDNAYLSLPLFDQKKNIASYAESFIAILPGLNIGESYRIFPYNIKGDNDKYAKIGVSVVLADLSSESVIEGAEKPKKLSYTYTKDGVEVKGDIPAVVWEEDYTGATTMNAIAKNKYLYEVLIKFTSGTPTQAPAPVASTKTEAPKAKKTIAPVATETHDDLPF